MTTLAVLVSRLRLLLIVSGGAWIAGISVPPLARLVLVGAGAAALVVDLLADGYELPGLSRLSLRRSGGAR